ncbi:hypothetical protein [Planctomicrobium piriforme]|uniref:hypothetical protein n=1 Tax=Planctomicrobium piriforme TaxID=1576369 RepID=UPI001587D7A4|nr:hypothetical protein [Planctomicrobium piriforme]
MLASLHFVFVVACGQDSAVNHGETNSFPVIALDASKYKASDADSKKITELIGQLKEIKDPDYGFAPFMRGSRFAPIKDSAHFQLGVIMIDHQLKGSEALEQLVAFGPKALPQLLDQLTNATPTQLVMEHRQGFGGQWYGHEVRISLANPIERNTHAAHRDFLTDAGDSHARLIDRHHVTIGDVCFVIVGQIVSRGYEAVRYQPTMCQVINSPTHDPEIAEIVRSIWSDARPAQRLLDSLLFDFYKDDDLASEAAMRLLFYFPGETTNLIANRTVSLDLSRPNDNEEWERIRERNGVDVPELLEAIRNFQDPKITDALMFVVEHTEDPMTLQAALTDVVVERAPDLVFNRIRHFLSAAPQPEQGPYGEECDLLKAAAKYFPDKSKVLFDSYRGHNTQTTLLSTIYALDQPSASRPWMIDDLVKLLDDRTETGMQYGPDYDRQPLRICDVAAKVLSNGHLKDVRFEFEKNSVYLDQQIEKIRSVAAGAEGVQFPTPDDFKLPSDLPQRTAKRTFEVDKSLILVHPFSNDEIIFAACGGPTQKGWGRETIQINASTGEQLSRVLIDDWNGGVSLLENGLAERQFAYHGNEGGDVQIRDTRTGQLLKTLSTPFHDGVSHDDPLQIRDLSDIAVCGTRSQWIIAVTPDGALHSIDAETGTHRIEWKEDSMHPRVIGIKGTSSVLLEGIGEKSLFNIPPRIWDQSTQTLTTVTKVPFGGWRAAWGDLAWNNSNGRASLWNLAIRQSITLPTSEIPIVDITTDEKQSRLFVLRQDGFIEVLEVVNRTTLNPIFRLAPSQTELDVSMFLREDGRRLFWLGRPPKSQNMPATETPDFSVVAVFDVE